MANSKRITLDWTVPGLTVYAIVRRENDKHLLNGEDGIFSSSPAMPFLNLTEDAILKGRYEAEESRTVWNEGKYTAAIYRQSGGSPSPSTDTLIGSGEFAIKDDTEVYLDAFPSFIDKWITNRLVEDPSGTWKLYDDDNVTVLKTWTWDSAAKTRSRAV